MHTQSYLLLSLCHFLHQQLLLNWNNGASASLAAAFKPRVRIYSSVRGSPLPANITLPAPPPAILIPLQLGSTFNFSKSFHIHFLIWPLQQSCEVGRASIIIPIWRMRKMKYNALKWWPLSDATRSWWMAASGQSWVLPRPDAPGTFQWRQSDCNWGHVNFLLLIIPFVNPVLHLL